MGRYSLFLLEVELMTHSVALNASSLTYFAHYHLVGELSLLITNGLQCDSRGFFGIFFFSPRVMASMTFGPPGLEPTTSSSANFENINDATPCTSNWLSRLFEGE